MEGDTEVSRRRGGVVLESMDICQMASPGSTLLPCSTELEHPASLGLSHMSKAAFIRAAFIRAVPCVQGLHQGCRTCPRLPSSGLSHVSKAAFIRAAFIRAVPCVQGLHQGCRTCPRLPSSGLSHVSKAAFIRAVPHVQGCLHQGCPTCPRPLVFYRNLYCFCQEKQRS